MKTVAELKAEFSALKEKRIPRAEKLPLAEKIRGGIGMIEMAAARDFGYPLEKIREAKEFLTEIDRYLA